MASLLFNFFKRAIIVPVIVTAIVIGALYMAIPKYVNEGQARPTSVNERIDLSQYSVKEYNSFSQLKAGDYVGTIRCDNIDLGNTAVLYLSENDNGVYVESGSSEPWNGGSVLIIGNDINNQFGKFYNSEKGDKIELEFYSRDTYTYKIQNKAVGVTKKEINNYLGDGRLVLAVPFNDFSNLGGSFFYTLYIAGKA